MKLFLVSLKNYKRFYTEAISYNDAEQKIKEFLNFKYETTGILTEDGSLKIKEKENEEEISPIVQIELVAEFIIR